jgi:threonine/homoserine/homoserine lactone efflux protein
MLPDTSYLAVFVFSFVVAIGAVISPGPVSTAIVSQTPSKGWITGPLVALGHAALELLLVALIIFGLGEVLARQGPRVFIALAGGILLAWMGIDLILKTWRRRIGLPETDPELDPMSSRQLFGLGLVATISNPFWYAWWVTIAAGYLLQAQSISLTLVVSFYLGHIAADFAWDTALSTVISGGRRWMSERVYRGLIGVCGAFLVYLALTFINQGISLLI